MLKIFENEKLNSLANDFFLMLFENIDEMIRVEGDEFAIGDIFPQHLVKAELKKCKKIYNEIYSWVEDEFLHNSFRPIHEYVLYRMLENQSDMEKDLKSDFPEDFENPVQGEELKALKKGLSEEEKEYLDGINDPGFYIDFLFEDNDFLAYKEFYDNFSTDAGDTLGYDKRIIELLPRDKRKELKLLIKKSKDGK
jgi:hypothetical protein